MLPLLLCNILSQLTTRITLQTFVIELSKNTECFYRRCPSERQREIEREREREREGDRKRQREREREKEGERDLQLLS